MQENYLLPERWVFPLRNIVSLHCFTTDRAELPVLKPVNIGERPTVLAANYKVHLLYR